MLFICCRTFAKCTKRFKGCHCPLRHVGTPLKTTTDCHSSTTEAFDLEFVVTTRWLIIFHKESFIGTTVESYFFFSRSFSCIRHSIFHASGTPHFMCDNNATTSVMILWESWKVKPVYQEIKRKVGQDNSGETNVLEENYIFSPLSWPGRKRISELVALFYNEISVDATWRLSTRNAEILFYTQSQFKQFVIEVGPLPQVCVTIRGVLREENS